MTDLPASASKDLQSLIARLSKKYDKSYTIAGKKDDLYRSVATAITKESPGIASLKRKRVSEARALKGLEATVPDAEDRAYASAKLRVGFIKTAVSKLRDAATTANPRNLASALGKLSSELHEIVDQYVENRNTAAPGQAAEDAEFEKEIDTLLTRMKRLAAKLSGRLQAEEKRIYDTSIAKVSRELREVGKVDITA